MMPMMALTMNGQSAASTSASDRNATGKAPVITVEKTVYSVGDKITVRVSNIPTAATVNNAAGDAANRNAKETAITVWYEVVELSASSFSDTKSGKKAMRKVSNSEHTLTVDKAWAGKQLKIVAENINEKVFSNEVVVKINAKDQDPKGSKEARKSSPKRTNQPNATPVAPAPTPKPAPAPSPAPAPAPTR